MANNGANTPKRDWRARFLQAFLDTGTVTAACREAGIGRTRAYEERQRNEAFALAWADVEEETTDELEREARRRAAQGVEKPVYQGKELVGHIREYSDTLLIFLLKGRRPDIYADRQRVEHSGRIRSGPEVDPEEVERLREIEERYFGEVE